MRSSKVLATLLSMVMLFCMLPGTVARADSPSIVVNFDIGGVRDIFSDTTPSLAMDGDIIYGRYSNSDIDGVVQYAVNGTALSSDCFDYSINDEDDHGQVSVYYTGDFQSLYDAGASVNVVVNGVAFTECDNDGLYNIYMRSNVPGIVIVVSKTTIGILIISEFLGTVEMYRLYNPNSGEHFYTSNVAERNTLIGLGWNDEGIGWIAPETSNTPVYRLYNENAGEHHYTMSMGERDALVEAGWKYEGIGWYSDDAQTVPLYRQYNPNAYANNHNYTTSLRENDDLVALGWRAEAIGWYGIG